MCMSGGQGPVTRCRSAQPHAYRGGASAVGVPAVPLYVYSPPEPHLPEAALPELPFSGVLRAPTHRNLHSKHARQLGQLVLLVGQVRIQCGVFTLRQIWVWQAPSSTPRRPASSHPLGDLVLVRPILRCVGRLRSSLRRGLSLRGYYYFGYVGRWGAPTGLSALQHVLLVRRAVHVPARSQEAVGALLLDAFTCVLLLSADCFICCCCCLCWRSSGAGCCPGLWHIVGGSAHRCAGPPIGALGTKSCLSPPKAVELGEMVEHFLVTLHTLTARGRKARRGRHLELAACYQLVVRAEGGSQHHHAANDVPICTCVPPVFFTEKKPVVCANGAQGHQLLCMAPAPQRACGRGD